tara:strand:+ start:94 stop:402 length:309 start_codon:yes stop_codon:yes gene_type:complete
MDINLGKIKKEDTMKIKINDIEKLLDETFDNTDSETKSMGHFGNTVQTVRTNKKASEMQINMNETIMSTPKILIEKDLEKKVVSQKGTRKAMNKTMFSPKMG